MTRQTCSKCSSGKAKISLPKPAFQLSKKTSLFLPPSDQELRLHEEGLVLPTYLVMITFSRVELCCVRPEGVGGKWLDTKCDLLAFVYVFGHHGSISSTCLRAAFTCANALGLNFYFVKVILHNSIHYFKLVYDQLLHSTLCIRNTSTNVQAPNLLV